MKIPAFKTIAEFEKWHEGLDPEAHAIVTETLDDEVHDLKSEEASEINNQGVGRQASYIGLKRVQEILPDALS